MSSRLEFLEKFSANNFASTDANEKQFILTNERKLKDKCIFIYEYFSKETTTLTKTLWE